MKWKIIGGCVGLVAVTGTVFAIAEAKQVPVEQRVTGLQRAEQAKQERVKLPKGREVKRDKRPAREKVRDALQFNQPTHERKPEN